MKTCNHCGRENEDQATRCRECGAELDSRQGLPHTAVLEIGPDERLEHMAVLDNEVQAELVEAMLSERKIPHILQSYHDSAYDGLFQMGKGWGRILAPPEFKGEILEILGDIKRQAESGSQPPEG
jgi:zinc ribbon protein